MTTQSKLRRMTVTEFLTWASAQARGRYELVRGEVVAMAPERSLHSLIKGEVFVALRNAVRRAGLPCTVFPDGPMVVIDGQHAREPDASVQCGVVTDLKSMTLEAPLIVVEVTSPSSERSDTEDKPLEYFSVPSIQHYLIVNPTLKVVIHHTRSHAGNISKRVFTHGEIDLTPPGMTVSVAELLPEIG